MELVLHMYVRGLHKLRMSCTVSASMQLSACEPYITDFLSSKEKFRWIDRFIALPICAKFILTKLSSPEQA